MITNLEDIKNKVNILDIAEKFLLLKKESSVFKALCPFHDEKTPSFVINPRKQMFFCFGCRVGGDVFKLVEKLKHLDFIEAVEEVARLSGLEVRKDGNIYRNDKKEYHNAVAFVNDFLKGELLRSNEGLDWIRGRGLSVNDLEEYDIGLWANLDVLTQKLKEQKLFEKAKGLGLVYENHKGVLYPMAGRVSFLIRNRKGEACGYSSRIIKEDREQAKYINSKDNLIYKKGECLYNFDRALDNIYKMGECIVVEGLFDAIAGDKLGLSNVVATCGTSFTEAHANAILRVNSDTKIILCFDNDRAGEEATLRTLWLMFRNNIFNVVVRSFRDIQIKDFGEILESGKVLREDSFVDLDGFEYFCRVNFRNKKDSEEQKFAFVKNICELVKALDNFFLKERLKESVARIFKCRLEDLEKLIYNQKVADEYDEQNNFGKMLELRVLKSALQGDKYFFLLKEYCDSTFFVFCKDIFNIIIAGQEKEDLIELSLNEKIKILEGRDFIISIKHLAILSESRALSRAKLEKNIEAVRDISARICDLKPF